MKKTQVSFNSTLRAKTPLKSSTPLKAKKGLKCVSKKQARRNYELGKIEPPADGRCQDCGELPDWRGLAKHHKQFRSNGGGDDKSNLVWLCGKCHSKYHGIKEV